MSIERIAVLRLRGLLSHLSIDSSGVRPGSIAAAPAAAPGEQIAPLTDKQPRRAVVVAGNDAPCQAASVAFTSHFAPYNRIAPNRP